MDAKPDDDAARPTGQQETARTIRVEVTPRSVVTVVAVLIGWWLLAQVWEVVLTLTFAMILAGTLSPVVDWLAARRLPRPLALLAVIAGVLAALGGLVALVAPAFGAQARALIDSAPLMQQRLADFVAGTPLGGQVDGLRQTTLDQVSLLLPGTLPLAGRAFEAVALAIAAFVLAFYLIAEQERLLGFAYALLPRRLHVRTARVLLDLEMVVGGYVRGQSLISLLCGLYYFALLSLNGTPNPLALAIFAAVCDLVPYFGGYLALVPAVLATLVTFGWLRALFILVAIVAYQEFEIRILIPRVYGRTLRLSPVAVIVALLIGAKLLGVVGALLALPIAAAIRVLVQDLRIELPGEVTGERAERAAEQRAEQVYARRTDDAPAIHAAQEAARIAERLPSAADSPVEERRDAA